MEKLGRLVSTRPLITVIVIILITLAMGALAGTLETEMGWESWMPDTKEVRAIDEIDDDFGNVEYAEVLVKSHVSDMLTTAGMLDVLHVVKALYEDEQVNSTLSETKESIHIAGIIAGYALRETSLAPTIDDRIAQIEQMSDAEIKASLASFLEDTSIPQSYRDEALMTLSKEYTETGKAKATAVFLFIDRSVGLDEVREVELRIEDIVKDAAAAGNSDMSVYGDLLLDYHVEEETMTQFVYVFIAATIGTVVISYLNFKRVSDIIISGLGLLFAVIWCMGFAVIMGWDLDAMSMLVPVLLIGLGIDYSIHTLMHYRERYRSEGDVRRAILLAIAAVSVPLLLATITTAIGFMSNVSSYFLAVRHFGILAAVGIVFCFIVMNSFVPAARLLLDQRTVSKGKALGFAAEPDEGEKDATRKNSGMLLATGERFLKIPVIVIIVAVVLAAAGGYGATLLEINYTETEDLPRGAEIGKTLDYINSEFDVQATEAMSILVKGDITDPLLLQRIEESLANMYDDKYVQKQDGYPMVEWLLPFIYTYANSEADPAFAETYLEYDTNNDGVLDSPSRESLTVLLDRIYSSSGETEFLLHKDDDGQYDKLVLRLYTNTENFKYSHELIKELEKDVEPIRAVANDVAVTGLPLIYDLMNINVRSSSLFSTLYCALAALVVLTITFFMMGRSLVLGVITTIPVVLVVFWTYGTLKLLGFPLNFEVALVGALTIALGIDYSIHVSYRFFHEQREGYDAMTSYRNTVMHTGRNIFFSAITTAFVFIAMMALNTEATTYFGAAGAIAIIYSFIAAVVVLPVLLILRNRLQAK
ncbi:MAG TPA: MMPL family transporter [Dehalococcoidia bacterium]|nr:MMPL family transporter [Dehalococcoidia bacterium]